MAPLAGIGGDTLHLLVARQSSIDTDGFYQFNPSNAAAIIFVLVNLVALFINNFQFFLYRAWFWWPMTLGMISECPHPRLLLDSILTRPHQWSYSATSPDTHTLDIHPNKIPLSFQPCCSLFLLP